MSEPVTDAVTKRLDRVEREARRWRLAALDRLPDPAAKGAPVSTPGGVGSRPPQPDAVRRRKENR